MSDDLIKRLRNTTRGWIEKHYDRIEAAVRIEQLERENDRLRLTIDAAAKLGRIVGFLGDDEDRISAFIEACGPDLIERASTTLAELEGEK